MPTHPEIIIATPHTDVFLAACMFFSIGKIAALPENLLEDPVRMILLLFLYLTVEKFLIVEQTALEAWKYTKLKL